MLVESRDAWSKWEAVACRSKAEVAVLVWRIGQQFDEKRKVVRQRKNASYHFEARFTILEAD